MPTCLTCDSPVEPDHRFCPSCGAPLTPDLAAPGRKTITILFCDLEGFTRFGEQFDPETQLQVIGRYYDALRPVIRAHGGRPQKYIGDAIQALFGVPQLHEDDALRAARCALAMREALSALNPELGSHWNVHLRARYGIATGEVAVGSVDGQRFFALGDAVNVASRLETAAPLDEILVDANTARLLSGHARLGPAEPLALKGKAAPVLACRLLGLTPDADAAATRLVGRVAERTALHTALAAVSATRHGAVRTVVGPAGIGKSSVVRAFMREAEPHARVVFGRCLPYGEGVTLRPLAEIVERLAGGTGRRAIAAVMGDDEDAEDVAARISLAVGFTDGPVALDDVLWAARRLLEAAARVRPLVVVIEDIHWAEPTLVNLLDHVAASARDVPLLMVCLARPEWLEREDRIEGEIELALGPLSDPEAERLLDQAGEEQRTLTPERARRGRGKPAVPGAARRAGRGGRDDAPAGDGPGRAGRTRGRARLGRTRGDRLRVGRGSHVPGRRHRAPALRASCRHARRVPDRADRPRHDPRGRRRLPLLARAAA